MNDIFDYKHERWKLTGRKILVKILEKKKVSAGGIIIPEMELDNDHMQCGIVLKYGAEVFLQEDNTRLDCYNDFSVGCVVKFVRYAGSIDKKTDEVYRTIDSLEVEAVMPKEEYEKLIGGEQ